MISSATIRRLERNLRESVVTLPIPLVLGGPSAPKPVEKPCNCGGKGKCKCEKEEGSCSEGDCAGGEDCGCESFEQPLGCTCDSAPCTCAASMVENEYPVARFTFSDAVSGKASKNEPLGLSKKKFVQLLKRMVAPLPIYDAPGAISVVCAPALEQGLKELGLKNGLDMFVADESKK